MKLRHILDIADDCIIKYTASDEWVFTTDELKKFSMEIIRECLSCADASSQSRIRHRFDINESPNQK